MSRGLLKILSVGLFSLLTLLFAVGCEQAATNGGISVGFSSGSLATAGFEKSEVSTLAITNMSFCVTQLKLTAAGGGSVSDDDGDDLFETSIGLVNVGDGSTVVSWGNATLPEGTEISGVQVEVHADSEACGVAYSMSYNGTDITQDIEMTFNFTSNIVITDGVTVAFDLANIITAIDTAYNASAFTNADITTYIENIQDSASSN
ncbi:MAG: hypothetical protein HOO06_06465 [Bdellovibrionaceae bacterium]|jgi:hypothetical protein|nr:hypothetical protein [Pseudobdellovibrionaceae bacterium]